MKRLFVALVLFFCVCQISLAQQTQGDSLATVRGRTITYHDINSRKPSAASYVFISLISGSDTTSVMSNGNGSFTFSNILPGKKRLIASSIGYKTTLMTIEVLPGDNALMVEVRPDYKRLGPSIVTAEVAPIEMRGDTLIFQPAAVRTLEGDSALEILRQMPGVKIKNGSIYVNGQKVKRAYVNGVMLFGDNPMAPFNTLMASEVTQIHSYEEASVDMRLRGDKQGKKDRVIDIRTKEAFISAWDAFAQGAGGADSAPREDGKPQGRYFAGVNANFFSERFLLNLNTYSNNIGVATNHYMAPELRVGSLGDYRLQHYLKTGIQRYWGDRLLGSNFKIDYSYQGDNTRSFSRSSKNYNASYGSPERIVSDTLSSNEISGEHKIHTSLTVNNNTLKSLLLIANLSFNDTESDRTSIQWSRIKDGDSYHLVESRTGTSLSWSGYSFIKWTDPSAVKVIPSVDLTLTKAPSRGEDWTVDTLASSLNRRYLNITRGDDNYSVKANPHATIRLKNTDKLSSSITLGYSVSFTSQHNTQVGLDYYDAFGPLATPSTNSINTFDFSRDYFSHGPTVSYESSTKSLHFISYLNVGIATLRDMELIPVNSTDRNHFFLPQAQVLLTHNKLSLTYMLDSGIPAAEQIRNRLNDDNPLYLVAGNPSLKPPHTHSAILSYNIPFPKKSSNIQFEVKFAAKSNAVVSKVSYFTAPTILADYNYTAIQGSSLCTFVNSPGSWNASVSAEYSRYSKRLRSPVYVSSSVQYQQTPVFRGDNLLLMRDFSPVIGFRLTPTLGKSLRLNLNGSFGYQESRNSTGQLLTSLLASSGNLSLNWNAPKTYFAKGHYKINLHAPISGNYSFFATQYFALSAGVRLLKNRLRISVSANDIFSAGSTYSIKTADDYVIESWKPSYGRYYLLTICYRINSRTSATRFNGQLGDGSVFRL